MLFCEATPYQNPASPDVHPVFRGRSHVHLMATEALELNVYASTIGLPLRWLQKDRHSIAHYDCTGKYMAKALADPLVVKLDRRQFVDTMISLRPKLKEQIEMAEKKTKTRTRTATTPGLAKPVEPEEPLPTLEEMFLPEYQRELRNLLESYECHKTLMAEAKLVIDGEDGNGDNPPVPGLKQRILTLMEEFEVLAFSDGRLKWSRFKSSRSTVSKEALILAGVDAATVAKATKKSEFWVLGLDAIPERE